MATQFGQPPSAGIGLIQVYTGNGKGKTTAALGLAVRARAAGKRVAIVYFDKGGEHYSERKLLGNLGVDWFGYGLDRIDPTTQRFRFGVIADDVGQAQAGVVKAQELLRAVPPFGLVVLDEVNTVVALGMIGEADVEHLIDTKPPATELVLTGRIEVSRAARPLRCDGACVGASPHAHEHRPSYFDRVDLLTEMRLVKHYFYSGTPAREGLDF